MDNYKKSKKIAEHILSVIQNKPIKEEEEFTQWLSDNSTSHQCISDLLDESYLTDSLNTINRINKKSSSEKLLGKINLAQKRHAFRRWIRYASTTAACIALFFISFLLIRQSKDPFLAQSNEETMTRSSKMKAVKTDNNAILVTSDGEKVNLYTEMDAVNAQKKVTQQAPDQAKNTLITPDGIHYQITLNDGSRVWINENSKLIFPAKFASNVREVILEGEAYFEVVPNEKAPFIVKSQNNSFIRVLGTKFNISNQGTTTYTTLVEGSVEVQSEKAKIVIKPSEQAIVNAEKKGIDVREVDVNLYTSWKDGKFTFKDMSVHEIMSKIGKWYHIQVEYDNINTQNIILSGSLRKYNTFREIIEVMEATDLVVIKIKDDNTIKIYQK